MTMTAKILAKSAGLESAEVGDALLCDLQVLSLIDMVVWDSLESNGLSVHHPERIVICFDHFLDESMGKIAASVGHPQIREFVRQHGIPADNVYDVGRHGISHQVPVEEGFVLPGTFCATHDTQGATLGAMNAFAIPLLSSVEQAVVTGDTWMVVPEALRIVLRGELRSGVTGKDVYLRLVRELRDIATGRVLEFDGPGIEALSIDTRLAIANGANHIGAMTSIFPADQRLLDYLRPRARAAFEPVASDPDATYIETREFQLEDFEPMISGPGDIAELKSLDDVLGTQLEAAFVGSCSAGRIEDLTLAANELRGKHLHPNVRMVVTPISSKVMREAAAAGLIATFLEAGATVTSPGCGACYMGNQSPLRLGSGETCISTSVENYAGRMGSDKASIYLANAAVVAASAVAGEIAFPAAYHQSQ
jgi:3-isopropylmalate/(R)-2-methylmalate dehydratase large subunit